MLQQVVPHSSRTENTKWAQGLKEEPLQLGRKNGVGVQEDREETEVEGKADRID